MAEKNDTAGIVKLAHKRMAQVIKVQSKPRIEAVIDLKMLIGGVVNMWEQAAVDARQGRPTLAINKLPKFLKSVTGDQRKSRPSVKVRPVDSMADPQIATVLEGHIRNIEFTSNANYSYDSAFKHATSCGFPGYWRILHDYTDDDTFEQDIKIVPIRNHFSVYMDHSCVPYQGKEKFGFIVETMSKAEFEKQHPGVDPSQFNEQGKGDETDQWFDDDGVRVAEYYYMEPCTKTIVQLESGETVEITKKNQSFVAEMNGQKFFTDKTGKQLPIVKERQVKSHKLMWCKICGSETPLEGPEEQAGRYIPIVAVMPEEYLVEGETVWKGIIRDARDPARLYNYVASANIEAVALSPKSPLMIGKSQLDGNENQWRNAHTTPFPYLVYNDANGNTSIPQRVASVQQQPGLLATMQQANMDFEDTIGIFRAGLGAPSNEKSGIAIRERKESSDVGTFEYHDNLSRAIQWSYRVLIDLIPKIYDTERGLRLMNPDESESFAEINKTVVGPTGETVLINDITVGKYDIVATLGPAYATQRQEGQQILSDVLTAIAPVAPQTIPIILPRLFKLMDYPEAQEIAEELNAVLNPGKDKDGKPTPPDPEQVQQQEFAKRLAALEIASKEADIANTESGSMLNIAKAEAAEKGNQLAEYRSILDEVKFILQQGMQPPTAQEPTQNTLPVTQTGQNTP